MTFNYRVIRTEHEGEPQYAIHECYYDNKDGPVTGWVQTPATVTSESRTGLVWVLSKMLEAVLKPVLKEEQDEKLIEIEPEL